MGLCKLRRDAIKTCAVRQQRVKQKQRGPLSRLRSVDPAIGEQAVHAEVSLSADEEKAEPIDKSNGAHFKSPSLDVIFHECEKGGDLSGISHAFARQRL